MTQEATLEKAFNAYLEFVTAELQTLKAKPSGPLPFELLKNRSITLRQHVERAEVSPEFADLVKQTLISFPQDPAPLDQTTMRSNEIGNFFRRSGCYASIYDRNQIDSTALLCTFAGEFRKDQIHIRYLVPLMFVDFYGYEVMEFRAFQIRRFSSAELSTILQNDIRQVFYESSWIDVRQIESYWFIDISGPKSGTSYSESHGLWLNDHKLFNVNVFGSTIDDRLDYIAARMMLTHTVADDGSTPFRADFATTLQEEFSAFPRLVELALEPLILFDWDSLYRWKPSMGPNSLDIPFVLEIDDDYLHPLHARPSVTQVSPIPDDLKTNSIDGAGHQVEGVFNPLFLLDEESDALLSFATRTQAMFRRLRAAKTQWHFLEISLLFLRKAFFSKGLQQLLWHITVLESLFGEKKEGLTKLLRNRTSLALGRSEKERKEIRKSFDKIYDLRSRLVHGNEELIDNKNEIVQLCEARNLASVVYHK